MISAGKIDVLIAELSNRENLDFAKLVVEQLNTNEYTKPLADIAKKAVAEVK